MILFHGNDKDPGVITPGSVVISFVHLPEDQGEN
jgi:hypothetical protein